jgi:malonyl-CoA decarboxylase
MVPAGWKGTLDNLRKVWLGIADAKRDAKKPPSVKPSLTKSDMEMVRRRMRECLEARGGEVSARQRAAVLGQIYLTLDQQGRKRFLKILAGEFTGDRQTTEAAARGIIAAKGLVDFLAAEEKMRDQLVSPRMRLLRQFTALPQGVKFLIELRADLLGFMNGDAVLTSLDTELRNLLATWFDVGFLECRQITWDSPAALLEKLIAYEAVHTIHSWKDLRNRLESDRRCYAFFHPAMPDEPLIFIEIAMVGEISGNIQVLLDEATPEIDPARASTAIFYSISNTQEGLRGISFGHFLIKRVADDLRHEFPNIRTFATLSPIPGFVDWMNETLAGEKDDVLLALLRERVATAAELLQVSPSLAGIVGHEGWYRNERVAQLLRKPLERLCVRYFHQTRSDGAPIDPVERFHLGNGARIERLHWLGDRSPNGMRQALGLMVNYLYRLEEIEKNHELYATERRIAISSHLRNQSRMPAGEKGEKRFPRIMKMANSN